MTTRPERPLHDGEVDVVLGGVDHHRGTGEKGVEGLRIEDINLDPIESVISCDRLGPLQVEIADSNLVGPIPRGQIAGDDPPDDPGTEQRDPGHETVSASASSKACRVSATSSSVWAELMNQGSRASGHGITPRWMSPAQISS